MHWVWKAWTNFFKVGEQSPCFTTIEKGGGNKRLVRLEPAYKADGIVPPDPVFSLATAAIAEAILMRTSAEQEPSLGCSQELEAGHHL